MNAWCSASAQSSAVLTAPSGSAVICRDLSGILIDVAGNNINVLGAVALLNVRACRNRVQDMADLFNTRSTLFADRRSAVMSGAAIRSFLPSSGCGLSKAFPSPTFLCVPSAAAVSSTE
jgi:hypothetical protein